MAVTPPSSSGESARPIYINPYATVAVKSHVPITLELAKPNNTKWASFFSAMCGKFGLMSNIDSSVPPRPVYLALE